MGGGAGECLRRQPTHATDWGTDSGRAGGPSYGGWRHSEPCDVRVEGREGGRGRGRGSGKREERVREGGRSKGGKEGLWEVRRKVKR